MQVAQRGTSTASITTTGYYTADRWNVNISALGTWTQSIENDAPTGSGFRKSLKMLCTTADASPASSDVCFFEQLLEGQDLQAFCKGTASAKSFTVSFWVKANVTGTYILLLQDYDNNRSVSKTYTVSSSATWEFKTITFPADTTGAFDDDVNLSLGLRWVLAAGSNLTSGTRNETWATAVAGNLAQGQTVNLASATNNYWQIAGVQLNVGTVAAPFEFKSYGRELRECQRYYYRLTSTGAYQLRYKYYYQTGVNVSFDFTVAHPVQMRSTPTSYQFGGTWVNYDSTGQSTFNINSINKDVWIWGGTKNTAVTNAGRYSDTGAYWEVQAELGA
jgi:hypothetical protein